MGEQGGSQFEYELPKTIRRDCLHKNRRNAKTFLKKKYLGMTTSKKKCDMKVIYGSKGQALQNLSKDFRKYGSGLAYYCDDHNGWHISYDVAPGIQFSKKNK